MHNLALSYGDAGRHGEALALFEKTLDMRRRVLPENHPEIGVGVSIDCSLHAVRALTPGAAGDSMDGLANCYLELKRHHDAAKLFEMVLRMRRRVLPPNHPHIGIASGGESDAQTHAHCSSGNSMWNLATAYGKLGRHQEQMALLQERLESLRRFLPENHPQIGPEFWRAFVVIHALDAFCASLQVIQ